MELLLKEGEAQDEKERRLKATEANGQSRVISSRLVQKCKKLPLGWRKKEARVISLSNKKSDHGLSKILASIVCVECTGIVLFFLATFL